MTRKQPSYADLVVTVPADQTPDPVPSSDAEANISRGRGRPKGETTLREQAAQLGVYVNPAFRRALKLYAAETDIKAHDCILEALEDWAKKRKITVPVRVSGAARNPMG